MTRARTREILLLTVLIAFLAGAALSTRRMIWSNARLFAATEEKAHVATNPSVTSGGEASAPDLLAVEISQRGPGMHRQPPDALKLPVARTLDLTHVTAANFATALGDDPVRIFNYVRDQIAYESYTGCLRGPRGTLLALAGNSVDRASLLANMLQHAGQRVRYAHGRLPEPLARELVTSMWAERPRPKFSAKQGQPSSAGKDALNNLLVRFKHDYLLIRDQLKRATLPSDSRSVPDLNALVKETQDHYWVQWSKNGSWIDLDPSFGDSSPGTKYAPVAGVFDDFPETLFQQVKIRVRLEEYTGVRVSSRVVFTRALKTSDLSGLDVVLSHNPENWKGPAMGLASALASAIEDTGRVKPVLHIGRSDWSSGEPFYPKQPSSSGMGGVFNALAGIGTRKDAPIASAEWLEFEFIAPNGTTETLSREIFDLVGAERRALGQPLSSDELRSRTEGEAAFDTTRQIYSMLFTTGRIEAEHIFNAAVPLSAGENDAIDVRPLLLLLNLTAAVASDALLPSPGRPGLRSVLFYPDSPRLFITDLSTRSRMPQLRIDLRRDQSRAVALQSQADEVFYARVFRGVVDGALERTSIEYLAAVARRKGLQPGVVISTSAVFDQAQAARVSPMLLKTVAQLDPKLPGNTRARMREALEKGYLLIVPDKQVKLADQLCLAWWQLDPRSGDTIAVTDDGLHSAGTEYMEVWNESRTEVSIFYARPVGPFAGTGWGYIGTFAQGSQELADVMVLMSAEQFPWWSGLPFPWWDL